MKIKECCEAMSYSIVNNEISTDGTNFIIHYASGDYCIAFCPYCGVRIEFLKEE